MTISNYIIFQCPHCTQLYRDVEYMSFNTIGAIHYSDGYKEGDMLPGGTPIVKCVNSDCSKLFHIDEALMIAEPDLKEKLPPEWESAFNMNHLQPPLR